MKLQYFFIKDSFIRLSGITAILSVKKLDAQKSNVAFFEPQLGFRLAKNAT
jgi:hypothetical protein